MSGTGIPVVLKDNYLTAGPISKGYMVKNATTALDGTFTQTSGNTFSASLSVPSWNIDGQYGTGGGMYSLLQAFITGDSVYLNMNVSNNVKDVSIKAGTMVLGFKLQDNGTWINYYTQPPITEIVVPYENLQPCVISGVTVAGWKQIPGKQECIAPLGQKCCNQYTYDGKSVCQANFNGYSAAGIADWAKSCLAIQPGPQPAPGPQPQPTPAPIPTPEPEKKKSIWTSWWMILIYVLVGLLIIGLVVWLILRGGKKKPPVKPRAPTSTIPASPISKGVTK